jgi:AraC-like DNA-binding protein
LWYFSDVAMKPIFQKLTDAPDEGFACKVLRAAGFDCPWHFHAEYELCYVKQSGGYRMVGDHLEPLRPDDLVLVGPDLPHIYQNDEAAPGAAVRVHALLIQFELTCVGGLLTRLPTRSPVRQMLHRARLGLHFTGTPCDRVGPLLEAMPSLAGLPRVIQFLNILETLAHARGTRTLASRGFAVQANPLDLERMNRVCQTIQDRLDQPLALPELARLVHLSDGAFSRYFHTHTGRTLPQFVNELRVGRACRLLAEGHLNVTEVAFACGFNNLSNFNRQFRRLKQMTPREYRARLVAGVG